MARELSDEKLGHTGRWPGAGRLQPMFFPSREVDARDGYMRPGVIYSHAGAELALR